MISKNISLAIYWIYSLQILENEQELILFILL